jgi:hypothetical protein
MPTDGLSPKTPQPDPNPPSTGRPVGANDVAPRGTIEPNRLRTILGRLTSGFYESAEVRDKIAARVTSDLP